ncbi:36677_t:CDS:2, partial [Racocetra persica]
MCQQNCVKLVAPFAGDPEKYCLPCFTTGMRFSASQKPERTEYYNQLIRQAQKELENRKSTTAKKIEKKFEGRVVNLCAENYVKRDDIQLNLESSFDEHLNHHSKFNNPDRLEKDLSHWAEKEIEPGEIIVLEGINALQDEEIRNMADLKIYIEADENVRLMQSTNLSEKKHVVTTRERADLIVCSNNWQEFEKEIEGIFNYIESLLKNDREELKKQLPELALPKDKKDGIYQELDSVISNLTKKIKIKKQTSEGAIESLENLEEETKELKNLKKLLEQIQGEEMLKVKIE